LSAAHHLVLLLLLLLLLALLRVPRDHNRRQHGILNSHIVVGIDADVLLLGVEWELAKGLGPQLVVALEVRPTPNPTVHDMWKAFSVGNLQPPVKASGDRHALRLLSWATQRSFQLLDGTWSLFQLLHKDVHRLFGPLLLLVALLPP